MKARNEMMSKKDYEVIAAALAGARRNAGPMDVHGVEITVSFIASDLAKNDPRFDRERFIAATFSECGATPRYAHRFTDPVCHMARGHSGAHVGVTSDGCRTGF